MRTKERRIRPSLRNPLFGESGGEAVAEHRQAALGIGLRGLVLPDILVLGDLAVFQPDDVDGDQGSRRSNVAEATLAEDVSAFGHDRTVLVAHVPRKPANKTE